MARNFNELRKKMSPQRQARVDGMAQQMMVEMLLAQIRQEAGLTQNDLADTLGIKQPTLSKLESQDDMQISTLRRIIQALGGELELVAKMPGGTIRLSQFKDDLKSA
ncbi:MAG: helix-turn-helix domain-containing protein [Phycisphaeraceae bacterium JB051]